MRYTCISQCLTTGMEYPLKERIECSYLGSIQRKTGRVKDRLEPVDIAPSVTPRGVFGATWVSSVAHEAA